LKVRRYSIKSKESKRLLLEISKRLDFDLETFFSSKLKVEILESDDGNLFLVNGNPLFFKTSNLVMPTLLFKKFSSSLPKVIVDMGAVPYVCKGANVMVPGIVRIDGEFKKNSLVLIIDERHAKHLALGESMYSSDEIRSMKKGVVIKSLHFVSDKIWNLAKALIEK
jgi:PUA domain protein